MRIDLETARTAAFEPDAEHRRLARLAGEWKGRARTWLDPAQPALEAPWEGRIGLILGERFARFEYASSMADAPFAGELVLAFESGERVWRTTWIDSFHTGSAILVSSGAASEGPISVRGSWFAGADQPLWGWRTELDDGVDGELTIRMYNVTPEGKEALGVEVLLRHAAVPGAAGRVVPKEFTR